MSARRIFVVGSLNMDLLQSVPRMPAAGETVTGSDLQFSPGGKGANQAYAASRLDGAVIMVGKVGNDSFGHTLRNGLAAQGVDVQAVNFSQTATGSAVVLLLPDGENSIVVSPGANAELSPDDVAQGTSRMQAGDLLLCQLETPLPTVAAALKLGRDKGAITILDPAPARTLPDDILSNVDILTPNEGEAAQLTPGADIHNLAKLTGGTIIIKLGGAGCLALADGRTHTVHAFPVDVVDTTAAGDTFNAALAVALLKGEKPGNALRFANAAAALSVTRKGAGTSAPTLAEVEAFLDGHTIVDSQ